MAGINVLSDLVKVGSKLEKTPTLKRKDVANSSENSAAGFAAMLSGSMNHVDLKGQNSTAGKDLEEDPSTEDSVPSAQNPNGSGSMLGYGNFVLPIFLQPMLQSDLPAGKEANSGNDVGQGTGELATAKTSLTNVPIVSGNNVMLTMLNLVSQDSDEFSVSTGMTAQKTQGDNPGITELDKYRQVIANLLEVLSGEITDNSSKGTALSSVSAGPKDLSQEMAKIVQGWMMTTDEVSEEGKGSIGQKGIQPVLDALTSGMGTGNPELKARVSTLLATLYPTQSQGVKDTTTPQGVNLTLQAEGDIIEPMAKGHLETLVGQPEGIEKDLEPAVTGMKDTTFRTHIQQKSAELGGLLKNENSENVQGSSKEEIVKGNSRQSVELSSTKDVQNPNSNVGIGIASNLLAVNVAGGKTIDIPVYEQISTVFREQAMNKSQDLKQLDIQLHPADLGKIQIGMRWENGLVHFVVQASEAATGQLLQNQLSDLRQSLMSQGVNCGSLQMGQDGERQQQSRGDETQRSFQQSNTLPNEDEDLISINPQSLGQDGLNRINVTA